MLSVSRPGNSSDQPRFTAWLCLGISKPSTRCNHLRLLYSSGRVVPSRTQVVAGLGLHHLGKARACVPSGQLQTTLEHHHPAPAQLMLPRGQKLVVSSQSQSLQLTGLGKSLPLTCQQQEGLIARGGYIQPTQKVYFKYPAWVIGEAMPLDPTIHLLH